MAKGFEGQHPGAKEVFTPKEIEILRLEAERERAEIRAAKVYIPFCLGEAMLKFAEEINRGNTWNTPRSRAFAKRIKKHLAASVKTGTSRPGARSKRRS